ncbi:MAG TPA: hypothetical protein VMT11_19925 [Myxococcaceae bacterium]|nr:hypothetical protein [Myxococcaceae bacterium]
MSPRPGRSAPDGRWAGPRGLDLEPLVQVVVALAGERAAGLLAGLADPLRRRALGLQRALGSRGRAERHAALALAFAPGPLAPAAAEDIPGALGARVRAACAPSTPRAGAREREPLERWARRLARELAERP